VDGAHTCNVLRINGVECRDANYGDDADPAWVSVRVRIGLGIIYLQGSQ